ncbi:MAG TPA: TAXI family TRAP transporter solute-binding subunit [Azospirillaceae bacterium]|nr:TAXI family TRAP transporter solute-binding subunit [Azospirillaceae bacterium]
MSRLTLSSRARAGAARFLIAIGVGSGALALGAVLFLAMMVPPGDRTVAAQETRFFRIATGTTAGTYFPIGGLLASAISKPPGTRPCDRSGSCGVPGLIAVAQASGGSMDNITAMRDDGVESALVQADMAYWALAGSGPFAKAKPARDLRAIASLYMETVHVVVRADSPIRRIADLKGKAVSLGDDGSGTLINARAILQANGLKEKDVKAVYLKPTPSADQLAEGRIDAFFLTAGAPVSVIADLARRTPVRLVGLAGDGSSAPERRLPFFAETVVPEGTYEGVPETRALGVAALWVVDANVPDQLVYQIAKSLWHPSNRRILDGGHALGQSIQMAQALRGVTVPLHPGALRYYQEVRQPGIEMAPPQPAHASN